MAVVNVNFTSVAIGSLIFMLCLSGALIIGAPMFKELKADAMAKQVGTQFAESQEDLEAMGRVQGYEENASRDVTSYIVTKLADMTESPSKGQLVGGAVQMGGMVTGVFTRMLFFTDIFPKGMMPEPFGTLFKVCFLVPFYVAVAWIISSKLISFLPFFGGGGEGG